MTARTSCNRLQVASVLYRFIEDSVLPGTGIDSTAFWKGFDEIVHDLAPKNAALLAERDLLWHSLEEIVSASTPLPRNSANNLWASAGAERR